MGDAQSPSSESLRGADLPSKPTEELPTPPDTPGPASTTATVNQDEQAEPEAEAPSPEETELAGIEKKISYHEDADLHVKVKEADGTSAVYSVRSSALETASRVWKESLATRESSIIDLGSESAFGLDVIFSIAHYKFADLPQQTDIQSLYELIITAEKYQTQHLLVPFVKTWVASLASTVSTKEGAPLSADKTLVLAWILGEVQLFSQTLSSAAYQSQLGADGTLLDAEGKPWASQPVSAEVLDLLAAARLDAVDQIIRAVSTPVNKLLNPQWYPEEEDIRYCHAPEADGVREECEQLQLGSAIMGLSKARLWPPPEASRIKTSATSLARTYGEVRMRRYQVPGLRFKQQEDEEESAVDVHATCGFGHKDAIDQILQKSTPLNTTVVQELESRAKTSGLFSDDLFVSFKEYLVVDPAPAAVEEEATPEESPVEVEPVSQKAPAAQEEEAKEEEKKDEESEVKKDEESGEKSVPEVGEQKDEQKDGECPKTFGI